MVIKNKIIADDRKIYQHRNRYRITSYNVCYTKLLRLQAVKYFIIKLMNLLKFERIFSLKITCEVFVLIYLIDFYHRNTKAIRNNFV